MLDDVLRVDVAYVDGMTLISLRGDVDADSVLALQVVLDELDPGDRVLIDMEQVDFMDSSGVNVLITQALLMGQAGGSLRIDNPSIGVHRVVEVTGLTEFFYETALPEIA